MTAHQYRQRRPSWFTHPHVLEDTKLYRRRSGEKRGCSSGVRLNHHVRVPQAAPFLTSAQTQSPRLTHQSNGTFFVSFAIRACNFIW